MSSNVWPPLTSQGMNKMLGHQAPESVSWFVTLQLLMRDHHKWHRRTVRCYIHPLDTDSSRRQSNEICLHLSSQSCVAFFLPRIVAIPLSIHPNKTVLPLESRKGGKTTVKQKIARQREDIRDTVTKVITLFLALSLIPCLSLSQWHRTQANESVEASDTILWLMDCLPHDSHVLTMIFVERQEIHDPWLLSYDCTNFDDRTRCIKTLEG